MNVMRRWLRAMMLCLPLAAGCDDASSARDSLARSPGETPTAETPTAEAPAAEAATAGVGSAAKAGAGDLPGRDAGGVVVATFDDIKFEMEKTGLFQRSMLTPRINAMMGQRIRIRGYIFPTPRKKGLTQFVLVRDNLECCFGPGAALFDCILVTMAPGKTAEYTIGQIAVEGDFRVHEHLGPDGRPLVIYQMTGESVE